ncbi:MAG TPA: metal-dependent transcriptional regulator [Candidatus Humimicrobiaceae bacterium]
MDKESEKGKNKETDILSHCLEDYLEAIYIINIDKKVVRVKELAEFLKVKTPSVVDAVSKLAKKGLVSHEKYGYLSLSKAGNNIARNIYSKHSYIYKFLNGVLGVNDLSSEEDACGIEHHISKPTLDKIVKFMNFIEENPGDYVEFINNYKKYLNNPK